VSLAAAIKGAFDVDATIDPGKPGQFDVLVDGKLVFSKNAQGRFPEHQEVLDEMSKLAIR
jgi:selT/selW/selH-like putative selenoprotein